MDTTKMNKLEKRVWGIMEAHAEERDSGLVGFMEDLNYGGCASGLIGELVYYKDTVAFYEQYEDEIWELIVDGASDGGQNVAEFIAGLGGIGNVGGADQFKNLLSWFAFEETAYLLYGRWESEREEE